MDHMTEYIFIGYIYTLNIYTMNIFTLRMMIDIIKESGGWLIKWTMIHLHLQNTFTFTFYIDDDDKYNQGERGLADKVDHMTESSSTPPQLQLAQHLLAIHTLYYV